MIRQAKQVLDVQSPAQRAAVEHVDRIMHDVSTFPEVVDGVPRTSVVTISYNALAAAREDALRGEVVFTIKYRLPCTTQVKPVKDSDRPDQTSPDETCTTDNEDLQKRNLLLAFVTRVLELFDGSLVRGPGGGWRDSRKILYSMNFFCRINGVNKQAAERRRLRAAGGIDRDVERDGKNRDVVPNDIITPCLTKVRGLCVHYAVLPHNVKHVMNQAQVSVKPFRDGDLAEGSATFTVALLHTHATSNTKASCLRHLRHETYATRKLKQYFDLGLAPKQASVSLDADIWRLAQEQAGSLQEVVSYHKALASNRYYRLPRAAVTSLYTRWRKTTCTGEILDGMPPYQQALASATAMATGWRDEVLQNRHQPPPTPSPPVPDPPLQADPPLPPLGVRGVQLMESRWALVLVPPLAARYAIEAPQSREIIFADASASLATFAVSVLTLYTSVCGAAAPLGFMIVTAMDEDLLTAAFREFKAILQSLPPPRGGHTLPEVSDSETWQLGPTVFMSDAEQAIRNAWHTVFPGSHRLLCHWHLLRAVWTNLYRHTREREVLVNVFTKFREMVYSETRERFEAAAQAFELACTAEGLHAFVEYINRQWMRDVEAWALYPRLTLRGWRGHNTNNICESQFAILKDFIFGRVRVSSYPQLIDRLCRALMDWYASTIHDRVFDDKLHRTSRHYLSPRSTGRKEKILLCLPVPRLAPGVWESVEQIEGASTLYIVNSSSRRNQVYIADLSAAVCTCAQGISGRICSHQVVAWQKYSESEAGRGKPNPFMFPKWSAEDKALFYYIATGRHGASIVHFDGIINLCCEDEDGGEQSDASDVVGDDDPDDDGANDGGTETERGGGSDGSKDDSGDNDDGNDGGDEDDDSGDDDSGDDDSGDDDSGNDHHEDGDYDGDHDGVCSDRSLIASTSLNESRQREAVATKLLAAKEIFFATVSDAIESALQCSDLTFAEDALRALTTMQAGMCPDKPSVQAAYWTKIHRSLTFQQSGRRIPKTIHQMGERPAKRGRASTWNGGLTNRGRHAATPGDQQQQQREPKRKRMTAEDLLANMSQHRANDEG